MSNIRDERRRRLVTDWLISRLTGAAIACALISLVLGVIGHRQYRPDAAFTDLAYSSIRLLVIEGPDGTTNNSPPFLLDLARFLALGASSATLVAVLLRTGAMRSDRWKARRATNHVVVFGSTPLAEELAVAGRTDMLRQGPNRVTLIGKPGEDRTAELRSFGIAVVPNCDRRHLVPMLQGANGVTIAESSDAQTLERFTLVQDIVRRENFAADGEPIDVRLVLATSELARLLRAQTVNNPEAALDLTAVSVPEAVGNSLVSPRWSAPVAQGHSDHAIVVGEGELARAVAMAVAAQRSRRGEPLSLTLFSSAAATWPVDIRTRFASETVRVSLFQGPLGPDWVARQVVDALQADETVHVYVVGIPDADQYTIGHRLATQVPNIRVLTVPEGERVPDSLLAVLTAPGTEWFRPLVKELVSGPGALDLGVPDQLGRMLLESIQLTAELPGHEGLGDSLGMLLTNPRTQEQWSSATASVLLGELRSAGFQLGPGRTDHALVLNGPPLFSLRRALARQLSAVAVSPIRDSDLTVLQRTGTEVPQMLQRIGVELIAPPNGNHVLTGLEQLAQTVHQHYLESKIRVGSTDAGTLIPWAQLDESQRESNRAQVRDIPSKLADVGLVVVPAAEGDTFSLSTEQVEVMARAEHTRWMTQKIASGWAPGPVRDDVRKIHNLLVEYDRLDDAQQELDREPARQIFPLLHIVGLAARSVGDLP